MFWGVLVVKRVKLGLRKVRLGLALLPGPLLFESIKFECVDGVSFSLWVSVCFFMGVSLSRDLSIFRNPFFWNCHFYKIQFTSQLSKLLFLFFLILSINLGLGSVRGWKDGRKGRYDKDRLVIKITPKA